MSIVVIILSYPLSKTYVNLCKSVKKTQLYRFTAYFLLLGCLKLRLTMFVQFRGNLGIACHIILSPWNKYSFKPAFYVFYSIRLSICCIAAIWTYLNAIC